MGITRTTMAFERDFTQIPNAWLRDERLSRRARGLLAELMTHRAGWHVTIAGLQKAGPEGRDAIRAAVLELAECGYLVRRQTQGAHGRFNEIEYAINDPAAVGIPTADGFSDTGGFTDDGSADDGFSDVGKSAPKNTSPSEDHFLEDDREEHFSAPAALAVSQAADRFDEFYSIWPRKRARPSAQKAWANAIKRASADRIIAAATAYRDNPHRPEPHLIPYPATWLNDDRWNDSLDGPRTSGRMSPTERAMQTVAAGQRLQRQLDSRSAVQLDPTVSLDRPSTFTIKELAS